ncbi:sulfite exporter TauE/SafE family protein [Ahrensia kielensis]|uniref:sulfite exporter TauE/SafE family protein n=1 Tax=Ahrensia kielensis TaxID=76980 RepID=UPI00036735DE|nr:sulfite exporter TauE/SafE family protein [Ahrensia kielensis]
MQLPELAHLIPDSLSIASAVLLITASFFTSAITAAFGVGGGVAMLALMGTLMPVTSLIPVHGLVQLGSNTGRMWRMRMFLNKRVLLFFMLGAVLGALLGGSLVFAIPEAVLKLMLGAFILLVTWATLPKSISSSITTIGIGGFITTILTMFLGASGPLVVALLAKTFDERKQLIANSAAAMTIQHALKVAAFGFFGFAFAQWLPLIMTMMLTGYLGTISGGKLLGVMEEGLFRTIFKIGVTLLALDMIRRGLGF